MISQFFKLSDLDPERLHARTVDGVIVVDGYFINIDQKCPLCESFDVIKNGHKKKTVYHLVYSTYLIKVILHIQRFKCSNCGNVFFENDTFTAPNLNISKESLIAIMRDLLLPNETFHSVGVRYHMSRQHIRDIFDASYYYDRPQTLPDILSIDEKHVNKSMTDKSYLCVLLDFRTKEIFDIYRCRNKDYLSHKFGLYPREERLKVKYITMDMCKSYLDLAIAYFPKAIVAIDSFHIIENLNRCITKLRCSIQAKYNKNTEQIEDNHIFYYFLKKYDYFFTMDYNDISFKIKVPLYNTYWSKYEIRKFLFSIDDRLELAYNLVTAYRDFNKTATIETAESELDNLIYQLKRSNISYFDDFIETLITWKQYIVNSFITIPDAYTVPRKKDEIPMPRRLSNGPIEGRNSIIEQIYINGKGFQDYEIFRKRVIYVSKKQIKICKKRKKIRKKGAKK